MLSSADCAKKESLNSCCWVPGCGMDQTDLCSQQWVCFCYLVPILYIKALRVEGGGLVTLQSTAAGDFSGVFFKYILYRWPLNMTMHYKLEHSLSTLSTLPHKQTLPNEPLTALPLTSCWKILFMWIWHRKDSSSYLYFYVILNIYIGAFSYCLYFTCISLCCVGRNTKLCLIWPIFISKVFDLTV